MSRESKPIFTFMVVFIFSLILQISPVVGEERSIVGEAKAEATAVGWLVAEAPLVGDDDLDGWTRFQISANQDGPWLDGPGLSRLSGGPGEWRRAVFARGMISPETEVFIRVTFGDPDGVVGTNPQILGPIRIPDSDPNTLTFQNTDLLNGRHGWSQGMEKYHGPDEAAFEIVEITDTDRVFSIHYSDTSVGVDADERAHIAYRSRNQALAYATNESGAWETETLLAHWPGVGRENDLEMGPDDNPRIASSFRDGNNEDLYFLTRDETGAWHPEAVITEQSVGMETSLVLSPLGDAHIAHRYWNTGSLMFSTNVDGDWVTSTVASASWDRTAIGLDEDGGYRIIYRDGTQLRHADASGVSSITSVPNEPSAPSVAIDGDLALHASFASGSALRYVTDAPGIWSAQSIDEDAFPGRNHAIAVDPQTGAVHLAYRDETEDALIYAHNETGDWVFQVVDDSPGVGFSCSISLAADGSVFIAYRRHVESSEGGTLAEAKLRLAHNSLCRGFDPSGDTDGDRVCDDLDLCPGSDDHLDFDLDSIPNGCDNCSAQYNPDQVDQDSDGLGAACDCDDQDSGNACGIFADGFETGDVSAWSTVP